MRDALGSACIVWFIDPDSRELAVGSSSLVEGPGLRACNGRELELPILERLRTAEANFFLLLAATDDAEYSELQRSLFDAPASSVAGVKLESEGVTVGVAVFARSANHSPSTVHDIALARYLGGRAAIALAHGRALVAAQRELNERRRLAERLRVLANASKVFSAASADYRTLLSVVAETVGKVLGEYCSIRLVSEDGAWLRAEDASVYHEDPELAATVKQAIETHPQRVGEGFTGRVAASGEAMMHHFSTPTELWDGTVPPYRSVVTSLAPASAILAPLMSRRRCLGVLSLTRTARSPRYDADDFELAKELADRAAVAVENALLLTNLEQRLIEIKKGEQKFRELLESAPDSIVIIDAAGKMVLINAQTEAMFGYSRQELLGQLVEMLIPAAYRREHPELRARYFNAPRLRHAMAQGLDLYGLRKDGSQFAAEINLSPITTAEGQLVTAVIRDVSERKRLEEARTRARELEGVNRRVQEASRLKSEFLANMSHELRTPLNAIIGFSALLHAGKAGALSATQQEYLGDILSSSRHLLQLINDVLDLAKIEAGKIELQPQPVDLSRVAAEVKDILRGFAVEKHVDIAVCVSPNIGEVVTDPRLLKQVLYNYLSNAIKFTPERGRIELRIDEAPNECFGVRVSDTGIGIGEADIPRLFEEFQQLDAGIAKKYQGTGLGLALTKRIVEAQGGNVGVESIAGQGSTFYATLPRRPPSD